MQSCKGYCDVLYELVNPGRKGFYGNENAKRCSVCDKRFFTPVSKCQCCGTILRTKPHNRQGKERLRNEH